MTEQEKQDLTTLSKGERIVISASGYAMTNRVARFEAVDMDKETVTVIFDLYSSMMDVEAGVAELDIRTIPFSEISSWSR